MNLGSEMNSTYETQAGGCNSDLPNARGQFVPISSGSKCDIWAQENGATGPSIQKSEPTLLQEPTTSEIETLNSYAMFYLDFEIE